MVACLKLALNALKYSEIIFPSSLRAIRMTIVYNAVIAAPAVKTGTQQMIVRIFSTIRFPSVFKSLASAPSGEKIPITLYLLLFDSCKIQEIFYCFVFVLSLIHI